MKKVLRLSTIAFLIVSLVFTMNVSVFGLEGDVNQTPPSPPQFTDITVSSNTVYLNWAGSEGADSYVLYRKTGSGKYAVVKTVAGQSCSNKIRKGKKYQYRVAAVVQGQYIFNNPVAIKYRKVAPTKMTYVKTSTDHYGRTFNTVGFKSKKGYMYYVYKKKGEGSYSYVGNMKATGKTSYFTDGSVNNSSYTYSVRVASCSGVVKYLSKYAKKNITTFNTMPSMSTSYNNLNATIKWKKVSGAKKYYLYRKMGLNGSWVHVKTIKAKKKTKTYSYVDTYKTGFKSANEKQYLTSNNFLDFSINPVIYSVRAYATKKGQSRYSNCKPDGDFILEAPDIVSVTNDGDNVTFRWGTIFNAEKYHLYSGSRNSGGGIDWHYLGSANQTSPSTVTQSATVAAYSGDTYYTVKAEATKNFSTIYSGFDSGFNTENRKYQDTKVLFFGDSITYGSPYYGSSQGLFSYPERVKQLTGVTLYNPSIPGSTYTNTTRSRQSKSSTQRDRIVSQISPHLVNGTDIEIYHTPGCRPQATNNKNNGNPYTYEDFDVIIMAAGTNDYLDNASIGRIDSTSDTEFLGAMNHIMTDISNASKARVSEGKQPIKVVFLNLFYSDRTYSYAKRTNRFTTKNKIGLTLTSYQNAINQIAAKYNSIDNYQLSTYQYETNVVNKSNAPWTLSDNLHMTRYTYGQIGNSVTGFLCGNNILDITVPETVEANEPVTANENNFVYSGIWKNADESFIVTLDENGKCIEASLNDSKLDDTELENIIIACNDDNLTLTCSYNSVDYVMSK